MKKLINLNDLMPQEKKESLYLFIDRQWGTNLFEHGAE